MPAGRVSGKGFRLLRLARRLLLFILIVFILPSAASAMWWALVERPTSWREANWGTSGILPAPKTDEAAIYVMAARTGGMKGAISVHTWLVLKKPGEDAYERYDKVGWGRPVRHNAYSADGYWYSNQPWIAHAIYGDRAKSLLPKIEAAIVSYPHADNGGYVVWPGPNSNSFVAHVLDTVPELGARAPSNATGRDFAPSYVSLRLSPDWRDVHLTFGGYVGFAVGLRSGLEVHFMGLAAGLDVMRPGIKIPSIGRIGL